MTPRTNRQLAPDLHELGWASFQRLSNELLSREPNVSVSNEYGVPGQRQHGIDLLAQAKPTGLEVGQCKCEVSFTDQKIRKASDEFFKHWAHWKGKGVRRFILFVACDVSRVELQVEMMRQRDRFAKHGMAYELWGLTTICIKLGPFRGVARKYIDSDDIVNAVCGSPTESSATISGLALVTRHLGILTIELEDLRGQELEALRELCRTGEQSKAMAGVAAMKASATWHDHTPQFQGRVLRFEAALHLNLSRNTAVAAGLVAEARQLDRSGDFQCIDAYLAYCRGDAPAALDHLASPRTTEARNLRWEILFERAELKEIADECVEPVLPLDAEAHRILAMVALARGDLPAAKVSVAKAAASAPNRKNVRLAKAAVNYFSALSPAAGSLKRIAWPMPVGWFFIKRDSSSIEALCSAEAEFTACATHPDCLAAEREILNVWRLACLACLDQRQTEAATLAQTLLSQFPDNQGVVVWSLHRGYPFNHDVVEAALRKHVTDDARDVETWMALWLLVWADNDLTRGEAVVDQGEPAFSSTGNRDVWLFHKAQFVARRDKAGADVLAAQITAADLKAAAMVAIARASARAAKAKKAFAESLAANYAATGDLRSLFECCELKLRLGDYRYIAEHAERLVTGIGTASALRLALEGVFRHGDYAVCLSLLKAHREFFRDASLSPDIRRLRAICQHALGDWTGAAQELGRTYLEQPSLATLLSYFDVLLRNGDTRRCCVLARDIITMKGAKPAHLLRAASVARLHDLGLAKELWRLANRHTIKNPNQATASLKIAFDLGLSSEAVPLLRRLQALARKGRGPLQEQTPEETIAFFRAQQQSEEKNAKLYEEGSVPLHLVFEISNQRPLVLAYHVLMESNRAQKDLLHTPVLFARSGARTVDLEVPKQGLTVDVSSLILAADIGILDQIEACFAPIHISPHATGSLLEQVTRLHPSQPDRQASRRKFLELVHSGKITTVDVIAEITVVDASVRQQLGDEHATLLELAAREKAVVLHDGPFLVKGSPNLSVALPAHVARQIVPGGSVWAPAGSANGLTDGSVVLLPQSGVASVPAEMLEAATRRFRIITTKLAVRELEHDVRTFEHGQAVAEWTQSLLDRVQRGIGNGIYRVLPAAQPQSRAHAQAGLATQALTDLLHPTGLTTDVVWCDDRMINRHLRVGDRPVASVAEILAGLEKHKAISRDQYYDTLLRLRQSNVRYLPMAEGEFVHHLARAEVRDGRLLETPALGVLRRYVNACMLDKGKLQLHIVDSNGNLDVRESAFGIGLRRAFDEDLLAVWKDAAADLSVREARADWLLENVYVDISGMRQALADEAKAGEIPDLVTASIGMLFTQGIGFDIRAPAGAVSSRRAFFDWLNARLLGPLKAIEPASASLVAKAISGYVISAAHEAPHGKNETERKVERLLWASFLRDLPEDLQSEIDLPPEVQAHVGMSRHEVCLRLGNRLYPRIEFWRAVAEAVNERDGHVREHDSEHEISMRFRERDGKGQIVIQLQSDDPAECGSYRESVMPVLADFPEERVRFMESHADWFDCTVAKRVAEMQSIAQIIEPVERGDALEAWRETSASEAYRAMADIFSKPGNFGTDDLAIPSWHRLLEHLRINPAEAVERAFPAAAESLLAEEGLFTALHRFLCFPARLPMVLEEAWKALGGPDAFGMFARLRSHGLSLVGDIHLLRLAALRKEADFSSKGEELVGHLLDPDAGAQRFDCFKTILWFVDHQFTSWREGRSLAPWVRLACIWYHTSRLHGFMRQSEEDLPRLAEWLRHQTNTWTEEVLARDTVFWSDRARPDDITRGSLVLHGIAQLLGDVPISGPIFRLDTALERLLGQSAEQAQLIRLELARRSDLAGNAFGTFLGCASDADVRNAFGPTAADLFATASDEELATQIEKLAQTPEDPVHWMTAHGVIGGVPAPVALHPRLAEILRTISFVGLAHRDVRILGVAITFACQQARAIGDETLIRRMEQVVFSFAELAGSQVMDEDAPLPLWLTLPNALLTLAVVPGNEDESARRFFDLFRRFAAMCPPLAQAISTAATRWTTRLPFAQQVNIWPFIFTLRALR